jgi:methionyl-tRNA formyltransferase
MTSNKKPVYLVAGCKSWNLRIFNEVIRKYPGSWHFVQEPGQLTVDKVRSLNPRYIFFLHWSWKVPDEIFEKYECVCFHMTDVPYGRGGSPLQNLIVRGHKNTKLTALKMVTELDAGPVYLKEDFSIESGSAEEIYIRATRKSAEMIKRIISEEIKPVPQQGEVTIFKRRRPEDSEIPEVASLPQLYDFIRMLDAEGYPRAFIKWRGLRFDFSRAALDDGQVTADVQITEDKGEA